MVRVKGFRDWILRDRIFDGILRWLVDHTIAMDDPSTRFILVLDIGSSSVRCSVYRVSSSTAGGVGKAVVVSRRPLNAVHPTSGKIRVVEVVNAVEECIDNVLQRLVDEFENRFSILAVGFSTFVMNLVGVDADGNAVGDDATASYACNTDEVAKEVAAVKRSVKRDCAKG